MIRPIGAARFLVALIACAIESFRPSKLMDRLEYEIDEVAAIHLVAAAGTRQSAQLRARRRIKRCNAELTCQDGDLLAVDAALRVGLDLREEPAELELE